MNENHFLKRTQKHLTNLLKMVLLLGVIFSGTSIAARNANFKVSGKIISDSDKQPLIGVSVMEKGTTNGTITNFDGEFSLNTSPNATLVFSYIGYTTQQIAVEKKSVINVTMTDNNEVLEELVVVGYGTIKKKLNTGATVQIKGDDLLKQNSANPLQAMQGSTPGVKITPTSGQPGSGINVTIRGIGSLSGSNPLYLIDGVPGNISNINSADIVSIDVLKDAASAAIYGSQASNGVVLVTTRTGSKGAAKVSFDGYYGIQNAAKKIELLNASEYATVMNVSNINSGKSPLYTDKTSFISKYADTDWMDEILVENAPTYDYTMGINGGSDASLYSISLGLSGQDGIVGGHDVSSYQRMNFRTNTEHKLYDSKLKVGQHLLFSYTNTKGIGVGGLYNNSLRAAFNTSPFLAMYDDNGEYLNNTANSGAMYKGTAWTPWNPGENNPLAAMSMSESRSNGQTLTGDIYAELEPIKGLKIKTMFGLNYYAGGSRSFTPIYQLSMYVYNNNDFATQSLNKSRTWIWDNTISYDFSIDENNFTVLGGTSSREFQGEYMYTKNADLTIADFEHAWIDNTTNTSSSNLWAFDGGPNNENKLLSYFGRLNWNYKEKYMANVTFRADGSSNFAKGNRWGYFPSVSTGWVLTNESFMEDIANLDFLKVRASWGQVGNQNCSTWQYVAPIQTANTYYYFGEGTAENSLYSAGAAINQTGAFPSRLSNENLKWETSEQTNFGFDARFFRSRLGVNLDYYIKINRDWLIVNPIPAIAGADAPYINGGDVKNSGIELALTWNDKIGKLNYNVSLNGSYNKNIVRNIPTPDGLITGNSNELYSNAAAAYRKAEEGYPIGYFWGYKTDGILQNVTEVNTYVASLDNNKANTLQGSGIVAGDVRYVDTDKNGKINEDDKTLIGNPNPDFTFGLSFSCDYKGFDFSLTSYGVAGNEIIQSYRNHTSQYSNYTTEILEAWTPLNHSNTIPRLTNNNVNYQISDLFVKKGDFLRLSNVQLGYDFSKQLVKSKYLSQLRLYVAVQNAYTLTAYSGMDPEVGYGTDSSTSGIDLGYYPRPRTMLVGVNIKF